MELKMRLYITPFAHAEGMTVDITWTDVKRSKRLDKWPRTMVIIYSYPSPPTGCDQELTMMMLLLIMMMMISSSRCYRKSLKGVRIITSWLRILDAAHCRRLPHWNICTFWIFLKNGSLVLNGNPGGSIECNCQGALNAKDRHTDGQIYGRTGMQANR